MSKRFGRNQKRALVAQLEQQRSDKDCLERMYRNSRDQLHATETRVRELNDAIVLTREVLGEFFVTLPPVSKELAQGVDVLDVPHSQPRGREYMPYRDCAELVSMARRFEQLEAIRHDIQKHFEDMRGMMHIRFRTGAGTMSYAFSPNSFKGMKRDRVAAIIADGLRRYMLENRAFFDRLGVK
jgi:hypothetical protein